MALPPLIPVEDFFSSPDRTGALISPDGSQVAYLAPWQGCMNVD